MSVQTGTKTERRRHRRDGPRDLPCPDHRARHPHLSVSALQHPVRLDDPDASGRRLPVRLEIFLRLYPLFVAVLAAAFLRPHSWVGTLKRGDVVVFRLPKDDSIDYIKRVIGLPGDKIQMIDGVLNINGEPVKRERIDDFVTDEDGVAAARQALPRDAAERRRATPRSISPTTASTTTRRSTPCRPATIS